MNFLNSRAMFSALNAVHYWVERLHKLNLTLTEGISMEPLKALPFLAAEAL